MSNIRLFFSATLSANMIDKLDKSQSHYLTKVMRVKKMKFFLYLIKMENGKQKF
jgi:16S rRNA (uracil1498-N3)-methyltransferase